MYEHLEPRLAWYLARLHTGDEVPPLPAGCGPSDADKAEFYRRRCCDLELESARLEELLRDERARMERAVRDIGKWIDLAVDRNRRIEMLENRLEEMRGDVFYQRMRRAELGETIHRLERRLSRANRKHSALHRAMRKLAGQGPIVLDADGVRIQRGDRVFTVPNGNGPYVVREIHDSGIGDFRHIVCCEHAKLLSRKLRSRPEQLMHYRRYSLEQWKKDVSAWPCEYFGFEGEPCDGCPVRDAPDTCEDAKASDLFNRAAAIAETGEPR